MKTVNEAAKARNAKARATASRNVHPKIEKLGPMIATTVIGRGYVSCVVVHISK